MIASIFKKAGLVLAFMLMFGMMISPFASSEKKTEVATPSPITPAQDETATSEIKTEVVKSEIGVVSRVVDGDTIEVTTGDKLMKIRIVGINTPETVDPRKSVECFGLQASAEAKKLLLNQKVFLEKDLTQDDQDRYGRYLRFVWLENSNIDYGKQMIANGYAFEYTYQKPYKYQIEYRLAQKTAETERKGLWADGACAVTATEKPASTSSPKASPVVVPNAKTTNDSAKSKNCSGPDLDCADFSTQAEAQSFFDGCGFTATNDPMSLDNVGVGNGVACESLP